MLQPYLSSSVKIRESHECAKPAHLPRPQPQARTGIRRAAFRAGGKAPWRGALARLGDNERLRGRITTRRP